MIQKVYNCSALLWCSLPRTCDVEISILLVADSSKQKTPKLCLCGANVLAGKTGFKQVILRLSVRFSSVQSLSHVQLFATPWTAAHQASLSITNFWSSLKLMSIESVMPSSHLIPCHPLLLLPPIPPSIKVFSNESTLCMRWPKDWSFSFSISPSKNTQDWSLLEWTGWNSLQSKGLSRVFSNTTVQKHQFFSAQLSSQSNFHIHTWPQEKP